MIIKRCPRCMADLKDLEEGPCPFCGFDQDASPQPDGALPRSTILHGKYLIGSVLGQGGFGITYIGFDLSLEIKVAIKEYYPAGAVSRREGQSSLVWNQTSISRSYRQSAYDDFLKEARKMARIDRIPSIVRVRETFLENETAYIIMDYVEGETLKARLKHQGPMSLAECCTLLRPMMEDLDRVHAMGLIHRDISPDNIMVQSDGRVKLLDLGAAKDLTIQKDGVSQLVTKKGFSPFEQYMDSGNIGPWTDVYALSATIYYACYGRLVPPALERLDGDGLTFGPPPKGTMPDGAVRALEKGLAVRVPDRTQSVKELLEALEQAVGESPVPPKEELDSAGRNPETPGRQDAGPAGRKLPRWAVPAIAGALAVVLGAGLYAAFRTGAPEVQAANASAALTAQSAASESGAAVSAAQAVQVENHPVTDRDGGTGSYTGALVDGMPSGSGTMEYDNGTVYEGEWADGWKSGHGTFTWEDGTLYEGEWANNLRNGQGVITFPGGSSYSGEWVDGEMDGHGTYSWPSGQLYEGDWVHGKYEGQGRFTYASGEVYEGEWVAGEKNGQGTMTYDGGAVYEGTWVAGKRNGQGTITYADGAVYSGSWANGQYEGQGRFTYAGGEIYEGEWTAGEKNGQGTIRYADGSVYSGGWADGMMSGQGTYFWASGEVYEGSWANGKRNGQGTITYADGSVYSGGWADGQKNGQGTYSWASGEVYEGSWVNGKREGQGTMTYADGKQKSGMWSNDAFVG